jgi:hypothetical protein
MPDTNNWRNTAKVLFRGLCTAGGIIAPTLTLGELTPAKLALGLGAGALTMLGSWRMSTAVQETADKTREHLPETEILLRNHDLNILVVEALKRAFQRAAADPVFQAHNRLIENLASEVEANFESLSRSPKNVLAQDTLPNLALRLAQSGVANAERDDLAAWEGLLDDLAARLANPAAFPEIRTSLATRIQRDFDPLIVAVFKEDATGRGPSHGRGWAVLTMLVWTNLFSGIRELKEYAASNDELMMALVDAQQRVSAKLDELLRWYGNLATGQKELADWLREAHRGLTSQLDHIEDLIAHGLQSPEEFRLAYWHKRRLDPGLELLWQDSGRAEILTGEIVGRSVEIAKFEEFIDARNTRARNTSLVQFWKGWPGTGKSRLMIEFADRATAAGCRVFFVSAAVHDLAAALKCLKFREPVVLLWDDYQGDKQDALKTFLDLQGLPHDPLGAPVKRVITSWPSHNVLGEKARNAAYVECELRPIAPSDDLVSYTRRLIKGMTPDAARAIVAAAESQPEAVLRAVHLVLNGTPIDRLPANLLENEHDAIIGRVLPDTLAERKLVRDALLAVALVARVDLGDVSQRTAFEAAGISIEALERLVQRRTVAQDGEAFFLGLDTFRSHVVRRAMDHQRPDVLSGTPQALAQLAGARPTRRPLASRVVRCDLAYLRTRIYGQLPRRRDSRRTPQCLRP